MSEPLESRLKDDVHAALKTLEQQGKVWFSKIQQVSVRGIPDYIICAGGKFIALELKRSSRVPAEPLQQYNINRIKEAGGIAYKVDPSNWDAVFNEITLIASFKKKPGKKKKVPGGPLPKGLL